MELQQKVSLDISLFYYIALQIYYKLSSKFLGVFSFKYTRFSTQLWMFCSLGHHKKNVDVLQKTHCRLHANEITSLIYRHIHGTYSRSIQLSRHTNVYLLAQLLCNTAVLMTQEMYTPRKGKILSCNFVLSVMVFVFMKGSNLLRKLIQNHS